MASEQEKVYKEWKKQFPFYMRILYFLGGYPPMHQAFSDKTLENWKKRFDQPEYDWKKPLRTDDHK